MLYELIMHPNLALTLLSVSCKGGKWMDLSQKKSRWIIVDLFMIENKILNGSWMIYDL